MLGQDLSPPVRTERLKRPVAEPVPFSMGEVHGTQSTAFTTVTPLAIVHSISFALGGSDEAPYSSMAVALGAPGRVGASQSPSRSALKSTTMPNDATPSIVVSLRVAVVYQAGGWILSFAPPFVNTEDG